MQGMLTGKCVPSRSGSANGDEQEAEGEAMKRAFIYGAITGILLVSVLVGALLALGAQP